VITTALRTITRTTSRMFVVVGDPFPDPTKIPHATIIICCFLRSIDWSQIPRTTRMVQLPATAAIEYVAAGCRTRTRTRTKTKTVRGGLMPVPPSSMRIRTV